MIASVVTGLLVLLTSDICLAAEYRTGQQVMGTILQVSVIANDVEHARRAAAAAVVEVQRWDDILTTWREAGELARLNRAAGSGPHPISPELQTSLARMMELSAATDGAFDPGVGPLATLWTGDVAPSREAIERVGPVGIRSVLSLDSAAAALAAGAALDSGAIGKGIGLDAAVELLQRAHVDAAFLDFGGSSQTAIGAPPDSPRGWLVAIAGLAEGEVRGVVALRDASLSTSRSRGPKAEEGQIVDPRSGLAVATPRLATVRAERAADADAWSTALVVQGRDGVQAAVRNHLDVFVEDAGGVVETPGFIEVPK